MTIKRYHKLYMTAKAKPNEIAFSGNFIKKKYQMVNID